MDLSVILIVVTIIVLSIILAAIGAYVVIHSAEEKESAPPPIDVSGQYAVDLQVCQTLFGSNSVCIVHLRSNYADVKLWGDREDVLDWKISSDTDHWTESVVCLVIVGRVVGHVQTCMDFQHYFTWLIQTILLFQFGISFFCCRLIEAVCC